ncbi:MAG: ABC transporter ATP-binding protein [Euryarchaeota archaeon]|nr:ABC transporter ATP-binding protein [Euryarchaeota archaeon]
MSSTRDAAVTLTKADLGHGTRRVLQGVDLSVARGERILLLGPNGSGKSTLLQTLAGLLPVHGGTVRVLGFDPLRDRLRLHERVGHLGHQDPLYPELTGRENLTLHARLRGIGPDAVERLLGEVGLSADADRRTAQWSRGMKRRLGLAKALLGTPELLLLDEPESGLDSDGQAWLAEMLSRPGRTAVVASHRPEAFAGRFDRVLRLDPATRRPVEVATSTHAEVSP